MADGYALKARLTFRVLPGNIQNIWPDRAGYNSKPLQLIMRGGNYFSINPGLMGEHYVFFGPNLRKCVEFDVRLRRTAARSFCGCGGWAAETLRRIKESA